MEARTREANEYQAYNTQLQRMVEAKDRQLLEKQQIIVAKDRELEENQHTMTTNRKQGETVTTGKTAAPRQSAVSSTVSEEPADHQ